jgi:hypothetical protein
MKSAIFVLLFFISGLAFSQSDSLVYTRDFEFKEGIYLTINQFKSDDPIPPGSIVSAIPKSELDFLTQVLENKKVTYIDEKGVEQQVATASIWGYCRNRTVI